MNRLQLLGKTILKDESPVLLSCRNGENFDSLFKVMYGEWEVKDGWMIGSCRENRGGILFSREKFKGNILLSFTAATVLPATRDINAVFHADWNTEINRMSESYVVGLNGWYEEKSGIERNGAGNLCSLTSLCKYTPGTEVSIDTGIIDGHTFLFADGVLITELFDTAPLTEGHAGFSPYCTKIKVKDITVRQIIWEKRFQKYEPEF